MSDVKITKGYIPGAIGRVAELNGSYYHKHWGFGLIFEAMVATDLSAFLKRYDETRDGFWTALFDGRIEGHITIDGIHAERRCASSVFHCFRCLTRKRHRQQAYQFSNGLLQRLRP